ncbi:MAG: hypothetical protein ABIG96_01960 [Candidatus Micrarchaeota archaeon]
MVRDEIPFSRMTDKGIVNELKKWIKGSSEHVRVEALRYLLEARTPANRTFGTLVTHLTTSDPHIATGFKNYYDATTGWSGIKKILNSRKGQIHDRLQRMQEHTFRITGVKQLPVHTWLREHGMTDLLPAQEDQITEIASIQTTIQHLLPNFFARGILKAVEPRRALKSANREMLAGHYVVPPEWSIEVRSDFKKHINALLEQYP